MSHPFFTDDRVRRGLTYEQYMERMKRQAAADPAGLPAEDAERIEFTKLNLHRSGRIGRTWRPGAELAERIARLDAPQLWLVLTEPWCGDSAQCLPCLAVLAADQPRIDLRLVLRDENPDIMDAFLTDGKRSIPRLVVFDADGNIAAQWGPRPAAAQTVFDEAKAAGLEKPGILEKLHLWYGRDRGAALDAELVGLFTDPAAR